MLLTEQNIRRLMDVANTGCVKGHIAEARAVYEGILAENPGFVPARIGQAVSYAVVDDFDAAEMRLAEILAANPDDRDAKAMMGLTYTLAGKRDEALRYLHAVRDGKDPAANLAESILSALF